MAESLINSIARLRVIEKKLLTKELLSRAAAAPTYGDCVRVLREAGFGSGFTGNGDEIEGLIRAHLDETYSIVSELMPERLSHITDAFRMRHDLTNIKLLYKTRLLGAELNAAQLDTGGVFQGEALAAGIGRGDYSLLPKKFREALEALDVLTYKNPDARLVSQRLDSAYIEYGLGLGSGFVREYFSALADFTNLITLTRDSGSDSFVPFGEYREEELASIKAALSETPERVPGLLKSPFDSSPLREAARDAFAEYLKSHRSSSIEKARDEYLVSLAAKGKSDIDSPAPIIGFMLAREREAELARLIMTVKRSGIGVSAIDERSLRLYG